MFWENRINIYDGTQEIEYMKINEVYGKPDLSESVSGFEQELAQSELRNELLKSISASGKSMFIDLRKQFEFETENFKFVALIKYKKINLDCQTWLNIKNNTLISPNHPNSINCSWLITSNFRSYIILNFEFIEVKSKS